jgi:8-oxo-dGTP pyrophosphatase MutT (NUDIX family)
VSLAYDQRDALRAAGVLFVTVDGLALFLRRVDSGDWSIPAGGVEDEDSNTSVCAQREAAEEVGYPGDFTLQRLDQRTTNDVDFTTYLQWVPQIFDPILNDEHDEYVWAPIDDPPGPLHPGLAATFTIMQKQGMQDAAGTRRGRDPTRTGTLRRAFRAAAELRLRKIRALLRIAVVDHDILGLGKEHINFAAPAARLSSFNAWFEAMTKLELASGWSYDWIKKAVASGEREARKELDAQHTFERATVDYLCEWAQTELAGIAAALTQQVSRAAAGITGATARCAPPRRSVCWLHRSPSSASSACIRSLTTPSSAPTSRPSSRCTAPTRFCWSGSRPRPTRARSGSRTCC